MSLILQAIDATGSFVLSGTPLDQWLSSPVQTGLFLAWLFVFGACIGSFLNVVVYRLPLGRNIARPGSYCPACHHPIRWHDNLPILGWILLRGRCRDCRGPISVRYPLVEAATASLFLAAGWLMLSHLRIAPGDLEKDLWPSVVALAGTLWLIPALGAASLIRFDRQAIPKGLAHLTYAVGFIHLPLLLLSPFRTDSAPMAVATGLAMALLGLIVGTILGGLSGYRSGPEEAQASATAGAMASVFYGPLFALIVGGFLCMIAYIGAMARRRRVPWPQWNGAFAWWLACLAMLAISAAWRPL